MKLVKFHKLVDKKELSSNIKTDIYVNPEKITWFEECFDLGRKHTCLYLEDQDCIDLFESFEDVAKSLSSEETKVEQKKQEPKKVEEQPKAEEQKLVKKPRKPRQKKLTKKIPNISIDQQKDHNDE